MATSAALAIALPALMLERDLGAPTLWVTAALVVLGLLSLLMQSWTSRTFYLAEVMIMSPDITIERFMAYTEAVEAERGQRGAQSEPDSQ